MAARGLGDSFVYPVAPVCLFLLVAVEAWES